MTAPYETSLSRLSEHDWLIMSARWARGSDWNIHKQGKRHWIIGGDLGKGFGLFKTKAAAYDAAENLMSAEGRHRLHLRMTADGYDWNGERYEKAAP